MSRLSRAGSVDQHALSGGSLLGGGMAGLARGLRVLLRPSLGRLLAGGEGNLDRSGEFQQTSDCKPNLAAVQTRRYQGGAAIGPLDGEPDGPAPWVLGIHVPSAVLPSNPGEDG